MDQTANRIREALDRAEEEIRELGAQAFRTGDDSGAGQARDIVLAFKSIRSQLNGRATSPPQPSGKAPDRASKRSKPAGQKPRKTRKSKYPRFHVRNGSLIRVGWSKKQKTEYVHKAPRETFERTVAAMAQIAATGPGPFAAEQVIERVNDSDNSFPGYQVYVVIGLLREHGCVKQVGREGYLVHPEVQKLAYQVWSDCAGAAR